VVVLTVRELALRPLRRVMSVGLVVRVSTTRLLVWVCMLSVADVSSALAVEGSWVEEVDVARVVKDILDVLFVEGVEGTDSRSGFVFVEYSFMKSESVRVGR
jgi:hypothetical protein